MIEEPIIRAMIMSNEEYVGPLFALLEEKRGTQLGFEYPTPKRVLLTYEIPLGEIMFDFYDRLKSVSRGYASFDYELTGYRAGNLVKLDMLVAGEPVNALSLIIHKEHAYSRGRALVEKMRQLIPRQLFEVPIQATIGNKVIARETVKGAGQKRPGEVLRRRHHAQAQAARKTERGQETHEARRPRRDPSRSLPRSPQSERVVESVRLEKSELTRKFYSDFRSTRIIN